MREGTCEMELKRSDTATIYRGQSTLVIKTSGTRHEIEIFEVAARWLRRFDPWPMESDIWELGLLWNTCPRWDWACHVLKKLGVPLWGRYTHAKYAVEYLDDPPRKDSMDEIRTAYTPFKEELGKPRTNKGPSYSLLTASEQQTRDRAGETMQAILNAERNAIIAANVHILEEALDSYASRIHWLSVNPSEAFGYAGERLWNQDAAGWVWAHDALATYRAAIAEKPRYRNKKTGAVMFYGGTDETRDVWLVADPTVVLSEGPNDIIFMSGDRFERDWEPYFERNGPTAKDRDPNLKERSEG